MKSCECCNPESTPIIFTSKIPKISDQMNLTENVLIKIASRNLKDCVPFSKNYQSIDLSQHETFVMILGLGLDLTQVSFKIKMMLGHVYRIDLA